ncbi:MAG: helix-turn-helix domain-containing protein [bacterium]
MTQEEVFDILKLGRNVYLTGSAGSGKTFLLNKYIDYLKKNNVEVGITASTGIAATHMNGRTIHSWSGLGVKDNLTDADFKKLFKNNLLMRRICRTEVLIIDEISMLHAFQLDLVNRICQMFRQSVAPFGGLQIVLCGDFFQLPPVGRWDDDVNFVYKSEVWQNMKLCVCYLSEQHRHSDDLLTQVLNDIRTGNVGEHTLIPLRTRYRKEIGCSISETKLYTHNADVDAINAKELLSIAGKQYSYPMFCEGNRNLIEILKKGCLAPEELKLKKGAVVMFVKNDAENRYVNGTLGTVVDFTSEGMPIVENLKNKKIIATAVDWRIEEGGKVRARIIQIPLRLAWAITVHKSQGMTLDAAQVDLSKSFVPGMGYVALSRVRSLDGLKLMGLNKMALEAHKDVMVIDEELKNLSLSAALALKNMDLEKKREEQNKFAGKAVSKPQEKRVSTYEKTKLLVLEKLSIDEIAKRRKKARDTIMSHLEKIILSGEDIDIDYLKSDLDANRFARIKNAFEESGDRLLSPVKEILGDDFSYDELRLARLFL